MKIKFYSSRSKRSKSSATWKMLPNCRRVVSISGTIWRWGWGNLMFDIINVSVFIVFFIIPSWSAQTVAKNRKIGSTSRLRWGNPLICEHFHRTRTISAIDNKNSYFVGATWTQGQQRYSSPGWNMQIMQTTEQYRLVMLMVITYLQYKFEIVHHIQIRFSFNLLYFLSQKS